MSSKLNKERISRLDQIVKRIIEEEYNLQSTVLRTTAETRTILARLKQEQDEIIEEKTRGAAIRSQCQWYEEGDKPSKFFLSLEQTRGKQKCTQKLKTPTGETISNIKDILKAEEEFYQELYTSKKGPHNDQYSTFEKEVFDNDGPEIDEETHNELTKPITEAEIYKIIQNSPKNKSPGCDGFTT